MPEETVIQKIVETGVTGAMLVAAVGMMVYITKRFLDHLEKLIDQAAKEREAQLARYSDLSTGLSEDRIKRSGYEAWVREAIEDFNVQLGRIEGAVAGLKDIERMLTDLKERISHLHAPKQDS